ncbi:MAG: DUF1028 domain-containing protein [Planctomycetes bacterium]|nr:DUF1028 domain-containing protein [Planctomycetota bacterium]
MRKSLPIFLACSALALTSGRALATFSIVAVDKNTGEVGCAGASCISSVYIIGDPIQGLGAINTQAQYDRANQNVAHSRMLAGDTPQQIVDYMHAYDSSPEIRQYGIVDLSFGGRSAAFTGNQDLYWAGHRTGPGYSIQGNILLGPQVVSDMERAFLASEGLPLADRLMQMLEAAAYRGADRRCTNTSSLSAFIKIARIGDGDSPYLYIAAGSNRGEEPIVALRRRYNEWKTSVSTHVDPYLTEVSVRPPVRLADGRDFGYLIVVPRNVARVKLGTGMTIAVTNTGGGTIGAFQEIRPGVYAAPITSPRTTGLDVFTVTVDDGSGAGPIEMANASVCRYIPAPAGR